MPGYVCRVRCTQIHGPGTILLGDAAHAVTPIGGQGCNAALEDGLVLDHVLQETGEPLNNFCCQHAAPSCQNSGTHDFAMVGAIQRHMGPHWLTGALLQVGI